MHNFGNDNTLSAWGEPASKLIGTLKSESNIAIDWLTKNEMIINRDNVEVITLDKRNPILQIFL